MSSIKKILITGGAGFIGSAAIRDFCKDKNFEILNLDKLTYAGNLESLSEIHDLNNYNFIRADIADGDNIKKLFLDFNPNIVINFAAESHVDNSIESPNEFITTNILGTFSLLEASRALIKKSRSNDFIFYHISTDEVFGDLDLEDPSFNEETKYDPSSPYSASKASSDHLVRAWSRTYGIKYIISNCSNNFGPFQYPEKLIPNTIIRGLDQKKIPVYGNGSQIRDWLYVDDHISAIRRILDSGIVNQSFNIGASNELRNIDVVENICDLLKKHYINDFNFLDLIEFVNDRPGHDQRYSIDATKLKNDLNWSPLSTFNLRLEETVLWYIRNEDWWRPLINSK